MASERSSAPLTQTSRERLVAELRQIEPPKALLDGLSKAARADLDQLLEALSEDERKQLAAASGPWPKLRPLLHLAAGGSSADALYELASSGRAGDELVMARQQAGGTSFGDLVASAGAVVERAARRWLRDRAAETATPSVCDQIDRAAAVLDRVALRRRARELAAELEPTSARHAAVATAAAWELDLEAARRAMASARSAASQDSDRMRLSAVENALAAAALSQAARGKTLRSTEALAAARANLRLGRRADAKRLIAPHARLEPSHLGVASVRMMAETPNIICPGLPTGAASPRLCALSWSEDRRVRDGLMRIERAWSSGGGRDEEAIGSYLGLAHFVPWVYGTYLAGSGLAGGSAAFSERIERVRGPLRAAVGVSSAFEGIVLFVDTLAALFEAGARRKPGERVHLSEKVQNELMQRAGQLAKTLPDHRYSQAGILAVATAMTQERDVAPIIALLPPRVDHSYAVPREVLRLWTAVASRDLQRLEQASGALAQLLSATPSALDSARLVLLMAEARAAALGTQHEHDVLAKIGAQLMSEDLPTELRLRSALDRAGALARSGNQTQAEATLERVLTNLSVTPGSSEADLSSTARAYLLVLRARVARGDQRSEFRRKLAELDAGIPGLPASLLAWRDLWLDEIDRLEAGEKCGATKACRARAAKSRLDERALVTRVGPISAQVMRAGVLAAGSMHLSFAFSVEDGLSPIVVFEPRLLAVELPAR
jgi:hypothetical protein